MPQEDGFLSPSLINSITNIHIDFAPWLEVAAMVNRFGMQVLPELKAANNSKQKLVAATLYGRTLTSFQSAVILSERGMLADARTVVRAATETTIILSALAIDPSLVEVFIERFAWHHHKIRRAWLADPEATAQMNAVQINDVKQRIAELETDFPNVKLIKRDPINIAKLAQNAGVNALYNAIYRATSGDAAHTSIDALNRHVRADINADIQGLHFGPEVGDLPGTLSDAISTLSFALHAVMPLFNLTQFNEELAHCVATWKALGIPSDFKPA